MGCTGIGQVLSARPGRRPCERRPLGRRAGRSSSWPRLLPSHGVVPRSTKAGARTPATRYTVQRAQVRSTKGRGVNPARSDDSGSGSGKGSGHPWSLCRESPHREGPGRRAIFICIHVSRRSAPTRSDLYLVSVLRPALRAGAPEAPAAVPQVRRQQPRRRGRRTSKTARQDSTDPRYFAAPRRAGYPGSMTGGYVTSPAPHVHRDSGWELIRRERSRRGRGNGRGSAE